MIKPALLGAALLTTIAVMSSCGSAPTATTASSASTVVGSASGLRPMGETDRGLEVIRVVDGDTLHVRVGGEDVTVRMIGINTPETVKEDSPVECYGPEASDYAKKALTGRTVTLEYDDSQGRTDQYGRTLAYVWLEGEDGALSLVNLDEVTAGVARERQYGPTPYAWKSTFREAQSQARAAGVGLWGACTAP
jgi:micrococcal nuclease